MRNSQIGHGGAVKELHDVTDAAGVGLYKTRQPQSPPPPRPPPPPIEAHLTSSKTPTSDGLLPKFKLAIIGFQGSRRIEASRGLPCGKMKSTLVK